MTKEEFLEKLEHILERAGIADFYLISADPEIEADCGITENGTILIRRKDIGIRPEQVNRIKFRPESSSGDSYISIILNDGYFLQIYFSSYDGLSNTPYLHDNNGKWVSYDDLEIYLRENVSSDENTIAKLKNIYKQF